MTRPEIIPTAPKHASTSSYKTVADYRFIVFALDREGKTVSNLGYRNKKAAADSFAQKSRALRAGALLTSIVEVALYDGDDLIDTTSKCSNCGALESTNDLREYKGTRVCRACKASDEEYDAMIATQNGDGDPPCPRCGSRNVDFVGAPRWACRDCRFVWVPGVDDDDRIAKEDAGEDDAPGMTPADIAFANLDKYIVGRGVVEYWGPDTDIAAVYANAAIAYELRAIRELLSTPPMIFAGGNVEFNADAFAAAADRVGRVIKIGD